MIYRFYRRMVSADRLVQATNLAPIDLESVSLRILAEEPVFTSARSSNSLAMAQAHTPLRSAFRGLIWVGGRSNARRMVDARVLHQGVWGGFIDACR